MARHAKKGPARFSPGGVGRFRVGRNRRNRPGHLGMGEGDADQGPKHVFAKLMVVLLAVSNSTVFAGCAARPPRFVGIKRDPERWMSLRLTLDELIRRF